MIKLNLARNCLRYLIRVYGIKEMFLPYYSCESVWTAVRSEGVKIKFYHIGKDFMPLDNFPKDAFVLYINYFGMCGDNCRKLEKKYSNLIADNTHAFYSENFGLASFNSLRKFFPVQNGAYLYTDRILDENFEQDKMLFTPVTMQENYEKFVKNELVLDKENIKYIYSETENFMRDYDFEKDKKIRLEMFKKYDKKYGKFNKIKLFPKGNEIPYCYPLSTDDEKILSELENIKTPLLSVWGKIKKEFPEYEFLNNTVAIPLNYCLEVKASKQ